VFVVFRAPARAATRRLPTRSAASVTTLDGPWQIAFQPGRGAPAQTTLERLGSWSESSDAGIRYFSGTGTYTKTLDVSAAALTGSAELWIDLGDVRNVAEITMNGRALGVAWKPPYRVNATAALRPGANELKIAVTDLWVNRLVGDAQPGVTRKVTFTVPQFYKADAPLVPSGLLGPVRLLRVSADRP
jgi:hypothetical protein